jgi:hypothetical protein
MITHTVVATGSGINNSTILITMKNQYLDKNEEMHQLRMQQRAIICGCL